MSHQDGLSPLARHASKVLRELFKASAIMGWAWALTVLGWALFWAAALGVIGFIPIAAAASIFVSGLALIPFAAAARRAGRKVAQPTAPPIVFNRSTVPS